MVNNLPLSGWGILCRCCSALWVIAICSLVNLTQERAFWHPPLAHTHTHTITQNRSVFARSQYSALCYGNRLQRPCHGPWSPESFDCYLHVPKHFNHFEVVQPQLHRVAETRCFQKNGRWAEREADLREEEVERKLLWGDLSDVGCSATWE